MKVRVALLAALVVLASTALAGSATIPGVTDSTILIGGTAPLTGDASSAAGLAKGADAYFKWVDAHGGVDGRQIVYKYVDDANDPAQTAQDVKQLVEQDQVFAVFNTLGTNNNLAIRDYLNQAQVPQLFVASGANTWGDWKHYPWTIGFGPSYVLEGSVYAKYVLKTKPKARIAVLYEDDPIGSDLLTGLKRGLGSKQRSLVAAVKYASTATDVSAELAQLKATKADTFMIFASGKFAGQAFLYASKFGWHPQIFVGSAANSGNLMTLATVTAGRKETSGAVSVAYLKDPNDPRWRTDPGLQLFRTILKQYSPGANPGDGTYVAGMAAAFTLVDALRKAGRSLTRDAVMAAVRSLNETNNPFVLPGIVIRTSPTDGFPVQQVGLQRWSGKSWVEFGGLVSG